MCCGEERSRGPSQGCHVYGTFARLKPIPQIPSWVCSVFFRIAKFMGFLAGMWSVEGIFWQFFWRTYCCEDMWKHCSIISIIIIITSSSSSSSRRRRRRRRNRSRSRRRRRSSSSSSSSSRSRSRSRSSSRSSRSSSSCEISKKISAVYQRLLADKPLHWSPGLQWLAQSFQKASQPWWEKCLEENNPSWVYHP